MRLPSALANGSSRARAPVATMMCLAASSVALPSLVTVILPGAGQFALAHVHRDLVALHQAGDALVHLRGDAAAARDDLGEVEPGLARAQPVSCRHA